MACKKQIFFFFFTGVFYSKCSQDQKKLPLTNQEMLGIAKEAFGSSFAKLSSYEFIGYKEDKIGLLGDFRQLKLSAQLQNGETSNLSLFVKSRPIGRPNSMKLMQENKIFERESFFYTKVIPKLQKDCDIAKWAPKPYFGNDEILIMEELKNYSDGTIPLSPQNLRAALNTLARFHASSILAEARLGQPLDKVFPTNLFSENYFNNTGVYHEYLQGKVDIAVSIAKKLEIDNFEEVGWKMMKFFNNTKPTKPYRKVFLHADLHSNNLMFDNNQPNHCIIVDFQIVRYGPLAYDLVELIFVNTYGNITEELKMELLKHYHNAMKEVMTKNCSINAEIPSFKDILEAFNDYDYKGTIMAIIYQPMHSISKTDRKNDKILDDYFKKGDSKSAILHFMDTNEKFKNQMKLLINNILSMQ